jgi:hypothetical protein
MLYRLLGRLFFYFYVVPEFARVTRKIVIPAIATVAKERVDEAHEKYETERAKCRRNHPAGSRLS